MQKRLTSVALVFVLLVGALPTLSDAQPAPPPPLWLAQATESALKIPGVLSAQGMVRDSSHFLLLRTRAQWTCAQADQLWQEVKAKGHIVLMGAPECWEMDTAPQNLPSPNRSILNFTAEGDEAYYPQVVQLATEVSGIVAAEMWAATSDSLPDDDVLGSSRTAGFHCSPAIVDSQLSALQTLLQENGIPVNVSCRPRCCYGILVGPSFKPINPMPPFEYVHLHQVASVPG